MSYKEIIDNVSNIENLDNTTILKTLEKFGKELSKYVELYPKVESISNPNLLINGDFRVNQRGQTSYTHTGKAYGHTYFVDRWFAWGENPFTFDVSTKTLTPNTSNTRNSLLSQWIEDVSGILGKTITYSVSANNTVYSETVSIPTTLSNNVSLGELSTSFGKLRIWSNNNRLRFDIIVSYNQSIVLNYAKVEIGSVATAFSPRPYAEELAMCQRYYQNCRINLSALANTITNIYPNIPLIQTLRTNPTTTITTMPSLRGNGSGIDVFTISSITFNNLKDNSIQLLCKVDASTPLQSNYVYQLVNGSCTFDAEIY